MRLSNFNSIKVQLKREYRQVKCYHDVFNFNSIKVQLKLSRVDVCFAHAAFQFHKGTIKTLKTAVVARRRRWFQFHKGTIKTRQPLEKGHCFYNFNSIKVQLKQTGHYQKRGAVQFQFHKGTIKTLCNAREMKGNADFNSIKVQLKRKRLCIS